MWRTWAYTLNLNRSLQCIEFDGEESTAVQGSKVTRQLLSDLLVWEVGLFSNTYAYPAVQKLQKCNADVSINSVLQKYETNEGHKGNIAYDSF